ncbi:hypothetical protein [Paradevosia shaoguanensis]|uniref:hypothetical protein n=1 Tax=Paradevosia shaoguanensis TaxID=1335043 RepID=UPI003C71AB04
MRNSVLRTVALSLALIATSHAEAAWIYQSKEDAFSDEVLHVVVGVTPPYSAGFRCTDSEDLELLYMTPEHANEETIRTLNAYEPSLLVRVDRGEISKIPVTIETTNDGEFSVVTGNDMIYDVAKSIAAADRRVSFAIDVLGTRMHTHEMDVQGSTKALKSLIDACGIE